MAKKRPQYIRERKRLAPSLALFSCHMPFQMVRDQEMSIEPGMTPEDVIEFFGDLAYHRRFLIEGLEDGIEGYDDLPIPILDWRESGFVPIVDDPEVKALLAIIGPLAKKDLPNSDLSNLLPKARIVGIVPSGVWEYDLEHYEVAERESLLRRYWDEMWPKNLDPARVGFEIANRRLDEHLEKRNLPYDPTDKYDPQPAIDKYQRALDSGRKVKFSKIY